MKGSKWWKEPKDHIEGKAIIRKVAHVYGCSVTEEERFTVDLHEIEPELWAKKSIRGYQADLLITKRYGKELYKVICEIDGGYHEERVQKDDLRDKAIFKKYGVKIVRFKKADLLNGKLSTEEIADKLGI